jgi:hypothetical protein
VPVSDAAALMAATEARPARRAAPEASMPPATTVPPAAAVVATAAPAPSCGAPNVISSGIKLMVLAIVVGIGSSIFGTLVRPTADITLTQAASTILAPNAVFGLAIFVPGIAASLITAGAAAGRSGVGTGGRPSVATALRRAFAVGVPGRTGRTAPARSRPCRQLELDDGDEELDGQDEEGEQHDHPRQQQHGDGHEVGEEGGDADELAGLLQERPLSVEPGRGHEPRPHQVRRHHGRARGLQPEPGERLEDDVGVGFARLAYSGNCLLNDRSIASILPRCCSM